MHTGLSTRLVRLPAKPFYRQFPKPTIRASSQGQRLQSYGGGHRTGPVIIFFRGNGGITAKSEQADYQTVEQGVRTLVSHWLPPVCVGGLPVLS